MHDGEHSEHAGSLQDDDDVRKPREQDSAERAPRVGARKTASEIGRGYELLGAHVERLEELVAQPLPLLLVPPRRATNLS
jgi:hypothetical protein